ncbi:hypothetical protein [Xenophilus sp. Marseille-Q4582]|uniref:hypothetical protein n=1 Tax=Xenophilus sp. Marseille-Q4582 TaxID=2866600 RepID=UPI001CE3D0FA|nr:hypothetical protein [Xenophilus sp. Marseille-Q4582]
MTRQPNDTPTNGAAPAFAFPTASHPEEGEKVRPLPSAQPGEDLLDDAISQSFPASDPVSVTVSPVPQDEAQKKKDRATPATPSSAPSPLWAVALVSTAALGVGAALLWGRHRRAQQPAARIANGLRGAWAQAGRQVEKARKQGLQEQKRVRKLLHGLQR